MLSLVGAFHASSPHGLLLDPTCDLRSSLLFRRQQLWVTGLNYGPMAGPVMELMGFLVCVVFGWERGN